MEVKLLDSFFEEVVEKPESFVETLPPEKDVLIQKVTKSLFDFGEIIWFG